MMYLKYILQCSVHGSCNYSMYFAVMFLNFLLAAEHLANKIVCGNPVIN